MIESLLSGLTRPIFQNSEQEEQTLEYRQTRARTLTRKVNNIERKLKRYEKEGKSDNFETFSLEISFLERYRRAFLNKLPQDIQAKILIHTKLIFYDDLVGLQYILPGMHEVPESYPSCKIVQDCSNPLQNKPCNAKVLVLLDLNLAEPASEIAMELLPKLFYFRNTVEITKSMLQYCSVGNQCSPNTVHCSKQ
ncbi:hypothetical protein K1719_000804 [Acacia pycnantha]|nr:hypothetical protein K1719_000804 [Acacia pycnantha]